MGISILGGDFFTGYVVFESLFFVVCVFSFNNFLSTNLSVAIDFRLFPRAGSVMSSKGVIDELGGACELGGRDEFWSEDELGFSANVFIFDEFGAKLETILFDNRLFGRSLFIELLFMR